MFKKPHYAALILVVLATLVALNVSPRISSRLKILVSGLFLPLFGFAGAVQSTADRGTSLLIPRQALLEQVDRLEQEVAALRIAGAERERLLRENEELRRALGWQRDRMARYRPARVVGRDTANWWRTVQIDMGRRDGALTNLAVVTPEGIVGRIGEVGYDRSRVVLVGDVHCQVSAVVEETRDQGVIEPGESMLDRSMVVLTFLPHNEQIQPGHRVSTSGLGGIFPRGIPIGRIVDTRSMGQEMYMEARVRLAVNLNRLETVWVLMP